MPTVVPANELKDHIGKTLGPCEWFEVDQDRINVFADVTLDHQFIHVDPDKAKLTPFGTTVAHGFLTLSLLTHLTGDTALMPAGTVMAVNYGFDKVRFIQPVKVGQRVRATVVPAAVLERGPGQYLIKSEVAVEIDGEDKPALVAEWLGLLFTG
ncbi:MAG: MaoC family dehydratase [Pseudomonadota bacterium]